MARYAFQVRDSHKGWTFDGVGQQDSSNTFSSREAAEVDLPNLARVLDVEPSALRVVEVADDFHAP